MINVPKVDLVGFSMGGMVAQIFAMEYPEGVNKLVLSGKRPGYGEGVVQADSDAAASPGGVPDAQPTEDYMLGIFSSCPTQAWPREKYGGTASRSAKSREKRGNTFWLGRVLRPSSQPSPASPRTRSSAPGLRTLPQPGLDHQREG